MARCVMGCGRSAAQQHHIVYRQALRGLVPRGFPYEERQYKAAVRRLERDKRNLIAVCVVCHELHHRASAKIPLRVLPDSVFEFAGEVMGRGAAFEYLTRRYEGSDPRLAALIEEKADA